MQKVKRDQQGSGRQEELDDMLKEALALPGVKEVMKVYHGWVNVSSIHESYLQARTPRENATTTDHSNAV